VLYVIQISGFSQDFVEKPSFQKKAVPQLWDGLFLVLAKKKEIVKYRIDLNYKY